MKTAEAFLATVDTDWRTAIEAEAGAGRGRGTAPSRPPEARCYFVASDDSKQSLGTLACGPVRRLGSAEGAVWDTARIEALSSGNQTGQAGQARLRIIDGAAWQQSLPQPADGRLVRPDGKEPPDDADKLAAPPTPQAAPGLIQIQPRLHAKVRPHGTDDPSGTAKLGDAPTPTEAGGAAVNRATLIAPDVSVTLTNLGTADTTGTGSQNMAPATGEQFLVARFTVTKTHDPVIGTLSKPVRDVISGETGRNIMTKFAVSINGESRSVALASADPSNASSPSSTAMPRDLVVVGKGYLVASVPDDASAEDVALTATTQGETQRLSLRTGKRTSASSSSRAEAYYRTSRHLTINQHLPAKTIKVGRDFDSTYTVGLTTAGLTAWDPDRGWAPAGRAWLRFGYSETWEQPSALYEITWSPDFFTATADRRPIRLPSDYNTYTRIVVAAVPADVKTVRITITAMFTFLEKPGIDYAKPTSGTADFGTLTTNATFE